ncbi:MAG: hypothetical protein IKW00_01035 [Clostridia bacterium]|nr:hypothetical protein [Clostridia bacterium]
MFDSERLDDVRSKLYGYCVQEDGIFEDAEFQAGKQLDFNGRGSYIALVRSGNTLTIRQDYHGSYGLYCYREGDYFALSNSLLLLMEYLTGKRKMTVNKDYAYHMFRLNSFAYSETIINEIVDLESEAYVEIDIAAKTMEVHPVDYGDNTVDPCSPEGIELLDQWYRRWTNIMRAVGRKTQNVNISLSGGFDSRLVFLLALNSGMDLSRVKIHSINDGLHTHDEDYEIASQIADHYGLELNKKVLLDEMANFTMEDCLNVSFYSKLSIHEQLYFKRGVLRNRRFTFPGSGGENVRACWRESPRFFLQKRRGEIKRMSLQAAPQLLRSMENVLDRTFSQLRKKHHVKDEQDPILSLYAYRDVRCRHHFAKSGLEDYFANNINLSPFMDPDLCKLKGTSAHCKDTNLIMTLIFCRYRKELLDFKFDSGRSIDAKTIAYAQKIADSYPFEEKKENAAFYLTDARDGLPANDNPTLYPPAVLSYLYEVLQGEEGKKIFASQFPAELYDYARNYTLQTKFFPLSAGYVVFGILRAIDAQNGTAVSSTKKRLDGYCGRKINLRDFYTARIDVRLLNEGGSSFEIESISDPEARVEQPWWIQKDGSGCVIESTRMNLKMTIRCDTDGLLRVVLRSLDSRDKEGRHIPFWLRYKQITVDDQVRYETYRVWHDEPCCLKKEVKAGKKITLRFFWEPCFYPVARSEKEKQAEKRMETDRIKQRWEKRLKKTLKKLLKR